LPRPCPAGWNARAPGCAPCSPEPLPMKPEKRELIHALLDEPHTRREATLLAGSRILRRRRWGRAALRTFAALALLTTTVLSLQRWIPSRPTGSPATPPAQEQAVQSLTDAEL